MSSLNSVIVISPCPTWQNCNLQESHSWKFVHVIMNLILILRFHRQICKRNSTIWIAGFILRKHHSKKKNAQNLMKAIVCSLFVKILFYHYIVCYWIAVFILDLPLETATSEKDCLQPIMWNSIFSLCVFTKEKQFRLSPTVWRRCWQAH